MKILILISLLVLIGAGNTESQKCADLLTNSFDPSERQFQRKSRFLKRQTRTLNTVNYDKVISTLPKELRDLLNNRKSRE